MARTHLTMKELLGCVWDKTKRTLLYNKLVEHDHDGDTLDTLVLGSAGFLTADAAGRAVPEDDWLDADTVARVVDAKAIDTGSIADSAIEALQINAAAVTEPKVAPSILTCKHAAVGAAGATVGIIPNLFVVAVADGSTVLDALTLDATYGKITLADVWFQKNTTTGGSTDAVQVCTDAGGTTAATSSIALNTVASGGIVHAGNIITANATFAAGAHIYVKRTHTTDCGGTLYVLAYRVA